MSPIRYVHVSTPYYMPHSTPLVCGCLLDSDHSLFRCSRETLSYNGKPVEDRSLRDPFDRRSKKNKEDHQSVSPHDSINLVFGRFGVCRCKVCQILKF
jgi:hypothetical protein